MLVWHQSGTGARSVGQKEPLQMKRSRINEVLTGRGRIHPLVRLSTAAICLSVARRDEGTPRRIERCHRCPARLGHHRLWRWPLRRNGALFLFTARNGSLADLKRGGGMCYAEKIMISRRDQLSPMHRHIVKTEDIINRGGATLAIKMFESDAAGNLDESADVFRSSAMALRARCLPVRRCCSYPGKA